MNVVRMDNGMEVPVLGIPQGVPTDGFSEKEILAALIAVEDILNMEGFSLGEEIVEEDIQRRHVFFLYDNEGEYVGDIWQEKFGTLRDVIDSLEGSHEDKLQGDYDTYAENGMENPDQMVEKALILLENRTYIRELLGSIDADVRVAMKEKYYGIEGGTNIKRAEALFNYGPADDYVRFDSAGRLDIDALGYLADKLIAAKIMDTQSAYEAIEYNGQLCEVYVDNGDISDFAEEIENGTLLECEGVVAYNSYRELIDAQKWLIRDDFNDIGLYDDEGNWEFYLTEKELIHIGLSKELEKEKTEYMAESVGELIADAGVRASDVDASSKEQDFDLA